MSNLVRTFAVTPGAHALSTLLYSLIKANESARITSFSSPRIRQLRSLGLAGSHLEIVEFGQIVGEVLDVRGGPAGFLPSSGLIEAAIEEACANLPEDDPLYRVAAHSGAHRVLARNWETLRTFGVELDSLTDDKKHSSVAQILRDAQSLLNQLGRRFNSDAMALCPGLESEPLPFDRVICIASEFRPAELAWFEWLSTQRVGVDLIVEAHASEPDFFLASGQTLARFAEPRQFLTGNPLSSALFSAGNRQLALFDVAVFDCPEALSECEWVLRDIAARVQNQDWSKVGIFCRSLEKYGPLLEAASIRLGIPLTMSRQMPLLSTSTARVMQAMLTAVASNDVRSLASFARYCREPDSELSTVMEVEGRVSAACRAAFCEPDPWGTLTAWLTTQETPIPWLSALLEWRANSLAPTNLASWRERLIELARHAAIHSILDSDPQNPREGNAVTALLRSLAQTASIDRLRSRRELNLSGFAATCHRLWRDGEVTIEGVPDGVSVYTSAEAIGLVDHLYVMGTVEGVFPRRRQEDPLFSDEDLARLVGTDPLPDSFSRARFEREEFYRVCCSPTSGLTFSYPRSEGENGSVSAFYLEETLKVVGKDKESVRRISPRDLFPNQPFLLADISLQQAILESKKPLPIEVSVQGQDMIRADASAPMSVKELNRALVCPFRWYAADKLKVHPHREFYRWSRLMQIPAEISLIGVSNPITAIRDLTAAADIKLAELFGEASAHDLSLMRAGVKRLITEWAEREFVARDAWGTPEEVQRGVKSSTAPFRSKIKMRDGRTIELKFEAPLVSRRGNLDVAHLFVSRDPIQQSRNRGSEELGWSFDQQDSLEILALLLMRSDRARGTAVEIDHRDGRCLIHFPSSELPARRAENVIPHALESKQDLINDLADKLQEAVAIVTTPTILPKPGQACDFCDYGELCRRHTQFSEDTGEAFA